MTEDALTEALDLVTMIQRAETSTAIKLAKAQLERFRLLGKKDAIEEMQRAFTRKAS